MNSPRIKSSSGKVAKLMATALYPGVEIDTALDRAGLDCLRRGDIRQALLFHRASHGLNPPVFVSPLVRQQTEGHTKRDGRG